MNLNNEPYIKQLERWPRKGRCILAQFDSDSIIVYQAYKPSIGNYAIEHGYLGESFKLTRMTWIKTNFLWMMYRSGWASKPGQEVILAIRLKRPSFDHILSNATYSTFQPDVYESQAAWKKAISDSDVRLQWDPDQDPSGAKVDRCAIQLGLRGKEIQAYSRDYIMEIQDITDFVIEQHSYVISGNLDRLLIPKEDIYPVSNAGLAARLGVSTINKKTAT